jgi:transketolase
LTTTAWCCPTDRLKALVCAAAHDGLSGHSHQRFRELGSHCEGHPKRNPAIGIEVITGPLGRGIANALGMAEAEARRLLKI